VFIIVEDLLTLNKKYDIFRMIKYTDIN
jgi:hypothetical protein